LDEPSIGLHPADNRRLLATLARLRDLHNTVIVVEHDEEAIRSADYLVDMGPGAGVHGGEVVAAGAVKDVLKNRRSLTAQYLSGAKEIEIPKRRRRPRPDAKLEIIGARGNNLKNVRAKFPLGLFICVTGVSGSGKSTLVRDILFRAVARRLHGAADEPLAHDAIEGLENLDKVVHVNQSPIGRTPRSNPATYTGLFTPIRELFAGVPQARERGYKPGRFSFNVAGGRCEACQGDGVVRVEMHFLPDVFVPCESCAAKRYNRETLDIQYKGKNIHEVLRMTVAEALGFFDAVPAIFRRLKTLDEVGLGYIALGQAATTLSGGEAQRVKLALELSKRETGRTLYILDEPTTGLHFHDIALLLKVLHRFCDDGNTVVVIEHNLEVIKTADWIVDLGPAGGEAGGRVIAAGSPEQIAARKTGATGKYLKPVLAGRRAQAFADIKRARRKAA
jgi:excinuclease ABC subunit A